MKKLRDIEKKFYEIIGIKKFKKMAFKLRNFLYNPFVYILEKWVKDDSFKVDDISTVNYNLQMGNGIQSLKDFKNMLLYNGFVHAIGVIACMPALILILKDFHIVLFLILLPPLLVNLYCVMLQRYNHIRINEVIEKHEEYEKLKEKREERKRERALAKEYGELLQYFNKFSQSSEVSTPSKTTDFNRVVRTRKFNASAVMENREFVIPNFSEEKVLTKKIS